MIVLDTNVLSALMRPDENESIVQWANGWPPETLWTSCITVYEIRYGLLLMAEGRRKLQAGVFFDSMLSSIFGDRILEFDQPAAEQAAIVAAKQRLRGRNVGVPDTQIAGIAISRGATLATRNVRDFADLGLKLADPWAA